VTIQTQIPDLMADLKQRAGAAVILITDLGMRAAGWSGRVLPNCSGRRAIPSAARRGAETRIFADECEDASCRDSRHPAEPQAAHRGLVFASRCGYAKDICRQSAPALEANRPRPIDNSCQRHRFAVCRHELPGTPAAHTFRGPSAAAAISRT
jgi:hypothetical protein